MSPHTKGSKNSIEIQNPLPFMILGRDKEPWTKGSYYHTATYILIV